MTKYPYFGLINRENWPLCKPKSTTKELGLSAFLKKNGGSALFEGRTYAMSLKQNATRGCGAWYVIKIIGLGSVG